MVTTTTVSFYMITAYTPTFGSSVLHLAPMDSLVVTLCVVAAFLGWLAVSIIIALNLFLLWQTFSGQG